MATTVPHKGGRGGFAVEKCLDFIDEAGDQSGDILIKSDTEEAVVEETPKGSKGSNWIVERA
eukprot:7353049-Karenia_brevis.AAC.1